MAISKKTQRGHGPKAKAVFRIGDSRSDVLKSRPDQMVYFVLHNNAQEGPYATADVKRLLREGRYTPENLCWREGWEDWRPLSSVIGLVAKSTEPGDETQSAEILPSPLEAEIPEPPVAWQQERTGRVEKRVVILLVAVLLLGAVSIVLGLLLVDSYSHIQREAEPAVSRAELERGLLEASVTLRGPQAADEIRTWVTYEDTTTNRPVAVSRANILIYPESMVADVLSTPAVGGASEMMLRLQSSLPPPWRETITDSNGVATVHGIQPGKYIVIAFAQKTGSGEPENYFWVARRELDEHPSQSLVFSEKNATTPKSVDFIIIK